MHSVTHGDDWEGDHYFSSVDDGVDAPVGTTTKTGRRLPEQANTPAGGAAGWAAGGSAGGSRMGEREASPGMFPIVLAHAIRI